jgi:hypothetical protein
VITGVLLALGLVSTAAWAVDKPGRCAAAKRIAAGRKALGSLQCLAAAARKAGDVSAVCLEEQHLQLLKAFSKAERRGGCLTTDDASVIEGEVDTFVTRVVNAEPAGPSTTTTTLLVTCEPGCAGGCPSGQICRWYEGNLACTCVDPINDCTTSNPDCVANPLYGLCPNSNQKCVHTPSTCSCEP